MASEDTKVETKPAEEKVEETKAEDSGKPEGKKKDKKPAGKAQGKGRNYATSGPTAYGNGYRLNVKNLPHDWESSKLKELFEPFGSVADAQIKMKENGQSLGFGFVVFQNEEEGKKAQAEVHDKEVGGKKLVVQPAERREPAEMSWMPDMGKGKPGGKGKGKGMQDYGWASAQAAQAAWMAQFFAMQQMYAGWNPQAPWGGADQSGAKEYEGSLKSISAKNGYGFIVCGETHALYSRDVYIDKELLPEGAKPKDRIKFTVTMNNKNHPKAATATLVSQSS